MQNELDKAIQLVKILKDHATGQPASDDHFVQLRAELLQNLTLKNLLPPWLFTYRDLDSFWPFIRDKFPTYAERRKFLTEEFDSVFNVLEFGELSQNEPKSSLRNVHPLNQSQKKGKVFLVHGWDNAAKQEVARHIESIGIQVIVLHEQASSGMTIIEKIEYYSNEADFALILYTACDRGRGVTETKIPARNRARQNVVFEHGYLMAKLGRSNVCALVKGEIETPNDISGVVYVALDPVGAWKIEVNKELQACGYSLRG